MSKRALLQTKLAAASLKVAKKVDGVAVTYSHQNGTAMTLWARPDVRQPVRYSVPAQNGLVNETEDRWFEIAKQTSSEGAAFACAVSENDELTMNGTTYVIRDWESDAYGGRVIVHGVSSVTRRAAP